VLTCAGSCIGDRDGARRCACRKTATGLQGYYFEVGEHAVSSLTLLSLTRHRSIRRSVQSPHATPFVIWQIQNTRSTTSLRRLGTYCTQRDREALHPRPSPWGVKKILWRAFDILSCMLVSVGAHCSAAHPGPTTSALTPAASQSARNRSGWTPTCTTGRSPGEYWVRAVGACKADDSPKVACILKKDAGKA